MSTIGTTSVPGMYLPTYLVAWPDARHHARECAPTGAVNEVHAKALQPAGAKAMHTLLAVAPSWYLGSLHTCCTGAGNGTGAGVRREGTCGSRRACAAHRATRRTRGTHAFARRRTHNAHKHLHGHGQLLALIAAVVLMHRQAGRPVHLRLPQPQPAPPTSCRAPRSAPRPRTGRPAVSPNLQPHTQGSRQAGALA